MIYTLELLPCSTMHIDLPITVRAHVKTAMAQISGLKTVPELAERNINKKYNDHQSSMIHKDGEHIPTKIRSLQVPPDTGHGR